VSTRTPPGTAAGPKSSRSKSAREAAGRSPLEAAENSLRSFNSNAKRVPDEYG
jgi:hypothetical protein